MSTSLPSVRREAVTVLGGRLTVEVQIAGAGVPLVYLHQAGGFGWDPLLWHLTKRYTVYVPEFPGTSPDDPHAIRQIADWSDLVLAYQEMIGQLGLQRPVLVGASFGGMLAADLAAHFPELPGRVVLLAPLGLWLDDAPVVNWNAVAPDKLPALLFHNLSSDLVKTVLQLPTDPEQMRARMVAQIWAYGCSGKFVWPFPEHGLRRRLHRITVPVLLVWGRQDRIVDVQYAKEFAAVVSDCTVAVLAECGHLIQLDQPQLTMATLDNFLA
ncbi:alpha/beta fold hydrolase [Salinispora pacifica]|uniref:alpha/beta fold hydrolase n=1 Tax=Salinispora pacifica TaxID=351187 RepID=UPI00036E1879|nr:alpha/beta hydrolase [Salinispora pacifica]